MVKKKRKKILGVRLKNLDERILVNILDKKKYRAIIFNNNGEQIATLPIKRDVKTFTWNKKTYITDFENNTYFKRNNFFKTFKYFFYNINEPKPINLNGLGNTKFDTELFNTLLETKVVNDLNSFSDDMNGYIEKPNIVSVVFDARKIFKMYDTEELIV